MGKKCKNWNFRRNRRGIPLPGRTDVQKMSSVQNKNSNGYNKTYVKNINLRGRQVTARLLGLL